MSRRLTLDDLWHIPQAYDPQLSPDGRSVVYVVRTPDRATDGYTRRIWLVDVASGQARPFTSGPHDGSPCWSPDGTHLAFVSGRGDADRPQLWLMRTDGGDPWRVTDLPGGVLGDLAWSPGGDRIAFVGMAADPRRPGATPPPVVADEAPYKEEGADPARSGRHAAVFVASGAGGSGVPGGSGGSDGVRQVTDGRGVPMSPAWSPDGTRLAYGLPLEGTRSAPQAPVYLVDADGGDPVRVTDDELFHSCVQWAPDGGTLVMVAADERVAGPRRLYSVPLGGGTPRPLLPGFDLSVALGRPGSAGRAAPAYAPDGRLLFLACDRSRDHLYEVPAVGGGPRKLIGGDDRLVKGFSINSEGLAYVGGTPATTGEVCVARPDGSGQRQVTTLFADALPDVELIVPESRTFEAPDGVPVHGWLLCGDGGVDRAGGSGTQPVGGCDRGEGGTKGAGGAAPLLLDIHGGPHDSWPPTFEGSELYQQVLAARGWHVLKLNMRGSDGYGSTFRDALVTRWGLADEGDYHAALDALVEEGTADPARLAVGGYSYGGFAACWLTSTSDRFAAAVTGGTICNLVSLGGVSDVGVLGVRIAAGADPYYENLELLARRSPLARVHRVATPTLILQGEAEQRAPLEQAEQWFTALHARGIPVRLVVYSGEGHGVIDDGPPSHRLDFNRRYVNWLREHVTGAPDRGRVREANTPGPASKA